MALKLRTVNNAGAPLVDSSGAILTGVAISFILTNKWGVATDTWDALTGERVLSVVKTVTTSFGPTDLDPTALPAGEFTIDLWPTSRSVAGDESYYTVEVDSPAVANFTAALLDDVNPIAWIALKNSKYVLSSAELSAFAAHIQDISLHNPALESANATLQAGIATEKAAAAALDSEQTAAAVVLTHADVVLTHADVIQTAADVAAIDETVMALATDLLRTQTILVEHTAFQ